MLVEWMVSGAAPSWVEANYTDGGYVYDTMARSAIRARHELSVLYLSRGAARNRAMRVMALLAYMARARVVRFRGDVVVRDIYSTVFAPFDRGRRNVVMLHHMDAGPRAGAAYYRWLTRRFMSRAREADLVVTVSGYWGDIMRRAGCGNVRTIYNAFDLSGFEFEEQGLRDFTQRHGLDHGRPIIYLGGADEAKGYRRAYEALAGLDADFVVTGRGPVGVPVRLMYLPYWDYLKLLRVSHVVVAMSSFREGWCRTAHEAMLCGTPVVGSGMGGMRELLEGGGQTVCEDPEGLMRAVTALLEDRAKWERARASGREFARRFDIEYFGRAWLDALEGL